MKRAIGVLIVVFVISSCEIKLFEVNPKNKTSLDLIAYYNPSDAQSYGTSPGLVKLSYKRGKLTTSTVSNLYPPSNLFDNAVIRNERIALGLHNDFKQDYSAMGASFLIDNPSSDYLPLIPPTADDDYAFFVPSSPKISENGFVFYISATNDKNYGDQYTPNLVRFDPSSNTYKSAVSPHAFARSQPEIGSDTEGGLLLNLFYPGKNGRYVYGQLVGMGVDWGVYHEDFKVLYRYDFETDSYSRIASGQAWVTLIGMTADSQHLFYRNWDGTNNTLYTYNTSTEKITAKQNLYQYPFWRNPVSWNSNGFCDGGDGSTTTNLIYVDVVNDVSTTVATLYNRPRRAQFSPDGSSIVFYLEDTNENYLCQTSDLTASATIDTIGSFSKEIVDFLVVE